MPAVARDVEAVARRELDEARARAGVLVVGGGGAEGVDRGVARRPAYYQTNG